MAISTDKTNYTVYYNMETGIFTGEHIIHVQGSHGSSIFESIGLEFPTHEFYQILDLNNIPNVESAEDFPFHDSIINCVIKNRNFLGQNRRCYFTITLNIVNSSFTATPEYLKFSVSKLKAETKSAEIKVSNPSGNSFDVTVPPFLTYTKTLNSITVTTVNSQDLEVSNRTENITITQNGTTITIPVNLVVTDMVSSEYGEINFCLDKKKLNFTKNSTNASILKVSTSYSVFTGNSFKPVQNDYYIPFYDGKCSIDIGEKVHQHLQQFGKNILNSSDRNHLVTHKTMVNVQATELDSDFKELSSEQVGLISFYPGKKPKGFPLLTNNLERRVLDNDKLIISYIVGETNPKDWGLLVPFDQSMSPDLIGAYKITPTEMAIPSRKSIEKLKLYKFPTPKRKIHAQWINQNLCPEWATFTGEFEINNTYQSAISQGVFNNYKKKFDSKKEQIIKINTGFLLKAEKTMISELIESPVCYLELEDRFLKCIPNTEKLVEEDSTLQLISFNLEMIIIDEIWK
ncbi:hypothetical protein [Riemerella columbina]|uniref:hypothetical protein n=1 Tax=Riemerella columbina TaxID=103810 RepID=UPI0003780BC1|nr:hypothetical protein [Riemerella columbina]